MSASPKTSFTERRPFLSLALCAAAVSAAAFLFFLPALRNGFVNWDDTRLLLENHRYRGLGWAQLRWMFTTHLGVHYYPLTWLSFAFDHALWGLEPFGFHLTNLLLHAGNAVLLFLIAAHLYGLRVRGPIRTAAALAALFFALHPLRVESVVWATERKDVLSGFFYLLTVLTYLKACAGGRARRRWYAGSLIVYLFSLLSKSVGASLPVALLILDAYPLRRLSGGPRKRLSRRNRRVLYEKLPYCALAAGVGLVSLLLISGRESIPSAYGGPARHVAQAAYGLAFYVWKTVIPSGLSPLYEYPRPFEPLGREFLLSGAFVLGVTAFALRWRSKLPALPAAWAFYAVTLLPSLGLVRIGPQFVADRYSYLPCLGFALLAGAALLRVPAKSRGAARIAAASVLLLLGILSWRQAGFWRDSGTLWRHALRVRPDHVIARIQLGHVFEQGGRLREAESLYRRAAELDPRSIRAQLALASVCGKAGRFPDAEAAYRRVLELAPGHGKASYRLSRLLEARGADAEELHDDALLRIRGFRGPYYDPHARAPCRTDDPALKRSADAAEEHPSDAKIRAALGVAYAERGDWVCAEQRYREALKLEPDLRAVHNNLGGALASQGRLREAVRHFEKALSLEPDDVSALFNLGNAFLLMGEYGKAEREYRKVLAEDPEHAGARRRLSELNAFAENGR